MTRLHTIPRPQLVRAVKRSRRATFCLFGRCKRLSAGPGEAPGNGRPCQGCGTTLRAIRLILRSQATPPEQYDEAL